MRIAIPTIWFHRGQSVVSQTLARALRELGHEVFIHARMGAVYGKNKQEKGRWGWGEATIWPEYDLKPHLPALIARLHEQGVEKVLFNEEYDWELVAAIKEAGFRVATYLDYLHKDWLKTPSPLLLYDAILCSTHRAYEMMPEGSHAYYIGWGIPKDSIVDRSIFICPYLFFENAGWLGINDRKGLRTLLECYQNLLKFHPELYGSLLIHAQVRIDPEKNRALTGGVDLMFGSMNQPGLYHMAQIYCYPAILDGLGLSLLEAIASGCAVICPDAPPWNEFVKHEVNGLLVPIAGRREREDGIAFPEVFVDKPAFTAAMEQLANDKGLRGVFMERNQWNELGQLGWGDFKDRIKDALEGLR